MSNAQRRPRLTILAIGIPGSGKTTLLKPLAERYSMRHVNRDKIREEWFGDPHVQEHKSAVRREADNRMAEALAAGVPVILDSIFIDRDERMRVIANARAAGAERVIGIVFLTPPEIAKAQNRKRKHIVLERIIDMMHRKFTRNVPTLSEGFDALYTSGQLDDIEARELSAD